MGLAFSASVDKDAALFVTWENKLEDLESEVNSPVDTDPLDSLTDQ